MNDFFYEVGLKRQVSEDSIPVVSESDLKLINSLNRNGPLRTLKAEEINVRSINILGEEPTSKMSIHPEGELNGRNVKSLSQIVKMLPGSPMMVGHRMDKTPWGRTFKAQLLTGQKGYNGSVVRESFWFMNDDEGKAIGNKIDGGIWAEGSISYWFKEAKCSICHKAMASFSFMGMSGRAPNCTHKIGQKDDDTGQVCYWYPGTVKAVAETSYVFRGAYGKTKSFLDANKDELQASYSGEQILAAKELELQLVDHGLDLNVEENSDGVDNSSSENDSGIPPIINGGDNETEQSENSEQNEAEVSRNSEENVDNSQNGSGKDDGESDSGNGSGDSLDGDGAEDDTESGLREEATTTQPPKQDNEDDAVTTTPEPDEKPGKDKEKKSGSDNADDPDNGTQNSDSSSENGSKNANGDGRNNATSKDSPVWEVSFARANKFFDETLKDLPEISRETRGIFYDMDLDSDEKESSLRDSLAGHDEWIEEGLSVLSSISHAIDSLMDSDPEKIILRVCVECDSGAEDKGVCEHCGCDVVDFEERTASVNRAVGPMKPKKSGVSGNEFFKLDSFRDLPDGEYYVEPKYDGVWMELHKKGGKISMLSDERNEHADKFPGIVKEAEGLKADNFVIAGEMTRWRGRKRLMHEDVTGWLQSKKDSYDDKEFRFKPFDLMVLMGVGIEKKPLSERRKMMDKIIKNGKQIHPTALRKVDHKIGDAKVINAINDRKTREGAMIKNADSRYLKTDEKLIYKWKRQFELDCRVSEVDEKKGGGFVYTCEIGRGKNVQEIGKTFATKIKAKKGDIVTVSVDHVRYDEKEGKYSWFAPKVTRLRKDKKLPEPLSTVKRIAEKKDNGERSANIITLTEVVPKLKRADISKEIYLVGGIVEEGFVTHDIDILSREALEEGDVKAIFAALGEDLSSFVDFTCDPEGPAGPSLLISADMKDNDGKWKYSNKFVLQEHGWGKKVHYDIRFGAPRTKRMWGWTCFSEPPTVAGAKKTRCQEKKYHDPKWMDVNTKKIEPGQPGNPTKNLNAWMVKEDSGKYDFIRRKPNFLEMVLHGKKLKGRYVWREIDVPAKTKQTDERHRVDGDETGVKNEKIWVMWKPKDQNASAPIKKMGYRYCDDCLVFWETDEIDHSVESSEDIGISEE